MWDNGDDPAGFLLEFTSELVVGANQLCDSEGVLRSL
jgi:hypothetical protein